MVGYVRYTPIFMAHGFNRGLVVQWLAKATVSTLFLGKGRVLIYY